MHIAWFRDRAPDASDPLDDTAALIDELRAAHTIDVFVEADAHDFVWRHFLKPWDLCVFELDGTRAHQFVWAYLLNYSGIVLLKSAAAQHSRGGMLSREGRLDDYMASVRFDDREKSRLPVRVPLLASRLAVVSDAALAESLREICPEARVRRAPHSIPNFQPFDKLGVAPGLVEGQLPAPTAIPGSARIGILDNRRLDVVERAFQRACDSGAAVELVKDGPAAQILERSDVVVALPWPPLETPLTAALAGMAAAKPVVTLELDATADWPALDPQTWRPRDFRDADAPIAVTIDPRDEEHSLVLAMRRLASDGALREQLGRAAHAWWQAHATPAHAAAAWNQILEEAASLTPPPRPADWPPYLGADGTELARAILNEFRVETDI